MWKSLIGHYTLVYTPLTCLEGHLHSSFALLAGSLAGM